MSTRAFADLIAPVEPDVFCETYWARRPLHVRRPPAFFCNLIGLRDVENYLSLDAAFERLSVTMQPHGGAALDPPPVRLADIRSGLAAGSSLRLRHVERFLDPASPTSALLRAMELALQHPLESLSCYVSPAGGAGFGAHHDENEIFTVQISGKKRWEIFHRVDSRRPGVHERAALAEATYDYTLEPGDVLYVPGGYVHDVTCEEASFSLTIVFAPFRWSTMLDLLQTRLAGTRAFTEPVPAGSLLNEDAGERVRLAFKDRIATLHAELDALDAAAFVDELATQYLVRANGPAHAAVADTGDGAHISLVTEVEKRGGIAAHLRRVEGDVMLVLAGGATLRADARAEAALRDIIGRRGPFLVSDIHESLSGEAKLALVKMLVSCGLLTLVSK
jgi:Cupin superfamily protein